ncbi:MAG: gfo/Idh/MocA family oxidoreductase [Rhizobiaceae bacterium]|nr:gfo/Idh/MocA family oxidoreductase [Rhizobiaceae bacterium]
MAKVMNVGIIGCGNISQAYMELSSLFKSINVVACADMNKQAAEMRAKQFGLRADSVDDLLKADDIDIIVNLTIPAAHYEVSKAIINAGKHVYSEKPFVLSVREGKDLLRRAAKKGVRVGSAPDTFLGGAHQHARHLIDAGAIGKVTGGTAHVMSHGMEDWHPNPDFFFLEGGGPVLDIGPYYITNLVQLLGPVSKVMAMSSTPSSHRTITSKPRAGEKIKVETPTTIHSLLEFESGAIITLGASWDVWHHDHTNMELYGEDGTLYVPDPNFFGGELQISKGKKLRGKMPSFAHALGVPNQKHNQGMMANYRTAGLADMASAIQEDRPHRCSQEMSLHVVDVMVSILKAGETGKAVKPSTTCDRPAALDNKQARAMLSPKPRAKKK